MHDHEHGRSAQPSTRIAAPERAAAQLSSLAAVIQRTATDPRALTRADAVALQRTIGNAAVGQLATQAAARENHTGLPDQLKAGIENLSGLALDDVRVHYNSRQPGRLQALAYTQGTDIHVAPGQEQHLPHEAWHVVQQKQGRVKPTLQLKGVAINDDDALEREAEQVGKQVGNIAPRTSQPLAISSPVASPVAQRAKLSANHGVATFGVDFKANHLAEDEKTAKEKAVARFNYDGKTINTVINSTAASLKTKMEDSEYNDWINYPGDARYYQEFKLDNWLITGAKSGSDEYVYGSCKQSESGVTLGGYFNNYNVHVTKLWG